MQILTPKQKQVLDFISSYLIKKGVSPSFSEIQSELGAKSINSVKQFVDQLIEKKYLAHASGTNHKRSIQVSRNTENFDSLKIPLVGTVAAGKPIETIEHTHDFFEVSKSLLKKSGYHFALKVKGNSMIGDCIMNNDIVIIHGQTTAENGQTVVAVIDNEATIKRFFKKKNTIELHPANPEFEIRVVKTHEDFHIKGVLVSVIRNLG